MLPCWCGKTNCKEDHTEETRKYRNFYHVKAMRQLRLEDIHLPGMSDFLDEHKLRFCVCGKQIAPGIDVLGCSSCSKRGKFTIPDLKKRSNGRPAKVDSWYEGVVKVNNQGKEPVEMNYFQSKQVRSKISKWLRKRQNKPDVAIVHKGRKTNFSPLSLLK